MADPASPRSVYLVATAGFPNYGDELITATWLRRLALLAPDATVWVDCPSPGPALALLDGLHPHVRFVDTLWRLCWEAPSDQPWEVADWVQRAVNEPGMAPRWVAGIEVLRSANVLHVIGGGYIHGSWPRHLGLLAGVVAAARLGGARAAMTGQGLIPTAENTTALLASLTARFDVVDVRDEPSAELLRKAGVDHVRHTCDDAFLGVDGDLYLTDRSALPEVMLCVQSDMLAVERSALADLVAGTLRAWRVEPENVGIVEGIPRVDRDIYALLENQLPGARFYPFSQIWRDGFPATGGQTWLSTRFHTHLVAAAAGASGVAVPVSPDYYRTKHHSLVKAGSPWTLLDGFTVPARPAGGGFTARVIERLRTSKLRLANDLYAPPHPVGEQAHGDGAELALAPERLVSQRTWSGAARLNRWARHKEPVR